MSNVVQINVEKTGFPVKIGDVELWFSTSPEALRNYINVDNVINEKMKELNEKTKHIEFPDENEINSADDVDLAILDEAFEYTKQSVAIQYDALFGDGTFDKLYAVYADTQALESALDPIGELIAERMNELTEERTKTTSEKAKAYAKKKQQKTKR